MIVETKIPGLLNWPVVGADEKPAPTGRQPLRLSDLLRARPAVKTRDLITMLLGIGARARRSSMPRVHIKLRVYTPTGKPAVRISLPQ